MNAQKAFDWMNERWSALLAGSIGCLVLAVALLVLLIRFAGRRVGREGIVLNRQDRIPFDLYLVLSVTLICTGIALCAQGIDTLIRDQDAFVAFLVWVGVFVTEVLALALIMTVAARVKSRTVFRNTLIWRLCLLIRRGLKALFAAIPLIWKAALAGGAYLVISLALILSAYRKGSGFLLTLWFILTLICVIYVLWWALQWKRVRMGTREIIGGNPDYHINSRLMSPDMKRHADELNNLGSAISTAVEERLKSERFKAELITNVSHDLKTPLTSIINYVDLLKKEEISNETAREYIGVLDRKSQRLKKLTEDLIEASKASTGALSVTRERLDLKQLIRQAAGEYEEKLTGAGLTLCIHLPDEPVHILADGRHMWRVLDNLLGNCVKYALEGTRIYVDVKVYAGQAAVTVKNISRQPLNIPAGQLMDRFVRGDESRTTEGSGLGLSIARSLTELQQGSFDLEIDGDLFKVTVKIPLAQE